jgi:hypothetical protein
MDKIGKKIYEGTAIYVAVTALPFWLLRYIANQKKDNKQGKTMTLWRMNQSNSSLPNIECKINDYFHLHFPNIKEIYFASNKENATEVNNYFKNKYPK